MGLGYRIWAWQRGQGRPLQEPGVGLQLGLWPPPVHARLSSRWAS